MKINAVILLLLVLSVVSCTEKQSINSSPNAVAVEANKNAVQTPSPSPTVSTETQVADAIESKDFKGTTEKTEVKKPLGDAATLIAIRAAAHDSYDRVVFEFKEPALPGYLIEFVDGKMRSCGSGDDVEIAGNATLRVHFTPAIAHTNEGKPTLAFNELKPALAQILELKRTCDFEAEVEWAVGSTSKKQYRVSTLEKPTRLVIDIKH